jgi:hypothetical protein
VGRRDQNIFTDMSRRTSESNVTDIDQEFRHVKSTGVAKGDFLATYDVVGAFKVLHFLGMKTLLTARQKQN